MAGNGIILHHPAMSESAIKQRPGRQMVDYLRDIHVNQNGWSDIGYHYVFNLDPDGAWRMYSGRPSNQNGAHAPGYNDWIGICVCIDWPSGALANQAMYDKLAKEMIGIADAKNFYLTEDTVQGHRDVYATKCPGELDVQRVLEVINDSSKPNDSEMFGPEITVQLPEGPVSGYNYQGRTYVRVTELEKLGYSVDYNPDQNEVVVQDNG